MGVKPEYSSKRRGFGELTWHPPQEMYDIFLLLGGQDPKVKAAIALLMEDLLEVELGILACLLLKVLDKPDQLPQTHRLASRKLRRLLGELNNL